MLVTALDSIPAPSFVACGIVVSEFYEHVARPHCNVWAVVCFCGFQKNSRFTKNTCNYAFLLSTKLYLPAKFHV